MHRPHSFNIGDKVCGVEILDRLPRPETRCWLVVCPCGRLHLRSGSELHSAQRLRCDCLAGVIAGEAYGPYRAIEIVRTRKRAKGKEQRYWKTDCTCGCGRMHVRSEQMLYRYADGTLRPRRCISRLRDATHSWRGIGQIPGLLWGQIRRNATSRGKALLISHRHVAELFEKQAGRCALSGIPLTALPKDGGGTASLDRIDSAKGYVRGNVQWVHRTINMMKHDLDEGLFRTLCRAVAQGSAEGLHIPDHKSIGSARG